MNKIMKSLSLLLILAMCVSASTISTRPYDGAESSYHAFPAEYLISRFGKIYMANLPQAQDYADIFLDSLMVDDYGFHIFPDYFGGIYIDDNGILVIQVVNTFASNHNQAAGLFQGLNLVNARFEFVEFSHNELNAMMQYLAEIMIEHSSNNQPLMFRGASLDELQNRVRVSLRVHNDEQIALFKRLFSDSPMIIFDKHIADVYALGRPFSALVAEKYRSVRELANAEVDDY